MTKRIRRTALALAALLALCLAYPAAGAAEILGKPFPDFTVTDVDGNTFTLSEQLKDHDMVLITLWATWCPPCKAEFPFLNEAYERYKDRVAFLALSVEPGDTPEKIREYRTQSGLSLPMARDENGVLYAYINSGGSIPVTVAVDRSGNAVFLNNRACFKSTREVDAVIEAVLNSGAETTVLDGIPVPDATAAFPVSARRGVYVENEGARRLSFRSDNPVFRVEAWVVPGDKARLRLELTASDSPYDMIAYQVNEGLVFELPSLLDRASGAYLLDVPMPAVEAGSHVVTVTLQEFLHPNSPETIGTFLIPDEAYLDELNTELARYGWTPGEETAEETAAPDAPQAYVLRVLDQSGAPVPGTAVNFCTDLACIMRRADENGVITFDGEPDKYHVQLLKVPDGYSFDKEFELYVGPAYGEWVLYLRKD